MVGGAGFEPEGRGEGEPLRFRQLVEPTQDRAKELVEARERQVRLGTDADGSQDPQARGFGRHDGVAEQGRFPDPGIATDQEGATSFVHAADELIDGLQLDVAAE
jgi:hypothetical protein